MAHSFRLDQVARRRAADLLIAGEQECDRQRGREAEPLQHPHRFECEEVTALHVEDARPVTAILLAPPWQRVERADRMHRVEVAHDEDAGLALVAERKGRPHAIAKAHAAGNAFDDRARDGAFARDVVEHCVDAPRLEGRALDLDPWA